MTSLGKRWLACLVLAGLVSFAPMARAAMPATTFVVAQAAPAAVAPVTYTPIRRAGTPPRPAAPPPVAPRSVPAPTPAAVAPQVAPVAMPAPAAPQASPVQASPYVPPAVPGQPPPSFYQPTPQPSVYPSTPWRPQPVWPGGAEAPPSGATPVRAQAPSPSVSRAAEPVAVAATQATRPSAPSHHYFGVGMDIGVPDGLMLGLVLRPADWIRISAALGTTSLSEPELWGLYRGGLSIVPLGWGPSFSFDAGHRSVAPTTSVIRTFFSVPSWVNPYVQELGYTFFNAHIGFDYIASGFTFYLHGGGTYLLGSVHAPKSVVVDSKTNTSISIAQDGEFRAFTVSAKAGIIYHFGGGG